MTKGDVVDLSRGKSKVLWQIELRWNISKVETHAFYWASDVATVNQVAGSDNENAGPPKAVKSVSFDDGQPPAKKPKKLPPLVVD